MAIVLKKVNIHSDCQDGNYSILNQFFSFWKITMSNFYIKILFYFMQFGFALSKYAYQNALVFPSSTALSMGSKVKIPFGSSLASMITVAIPYWYTTVSPKLKMEKSK